MPVLAGDRRQRASLVRFATAQGYLVLEARDLDAARDQLEHARPDLVLLNDDVITRTAHLKELMREKQWKVTPRPVTVTRVAQPARMNLHVEHDAA